MRRSVDVRFAMKLLLTTDTAEEDSAGTAQCWEVSEEPEHPGRAAVLFAVYEGEI
jgi:hypothetical protein